MQEIDSVVMVVMLMRRNATQAAAAAHFHCSQPTASRRWDLLRPVIGKVLAPYVPDPVQVLGREGTALVDGTVCPVWDWSAIPDLYSGKAKYTGMNVQIACSLKGDVAAIGPVPVHGARHDAYAFETSGLKEILQGANSLIITVFGEEEQSGDGCEHALELADRAAVAAAFPAEHPPCLHLCHGVLDV